MVGGLEATMPDVEIPDATVPEATTLLKVREDEDSTSTADATTGEEGAYGEFG